MFRSLCSSKLTNAGLWFNKVCRKSSSVAELHNRQLVEISGPESGKLLQGLFTNDINNLSGTHTALYTHLLNVRGRIMFDNIVYRPNDDVYFIEVDKSLVSKFLKFVSMYNIRSKAKIAVRDEPVYASFVPGSSLLDGGYVDPRLPLLGCRHIGSPPDRASTVSLHEYDRHRVALGVSEGARDISSGKDFPFEHNLDFLSGVSFSKGCYIGQELTARTHHVGETRKRVVPVKLSEDVEDTQLSLPARISLGSRAAGKLLSTYGDIGLAVLRFPYLDQELSIKDSHVTLVGRKPAWWPEEMR
ncbi:hypothetical protein ACHWQZ_G003869 [Mnemiopsis leidyi]